MGARAVATIHINWSVMTIPSKLYLTASAESVSFRMLNPETNNPVKQFLFDSNDVDESGDLVKGAKPLSRSGTIKGYEYEKGKFVTFTDEELEGMYPAKSTDVVIKEFVPLSELETLGVEKSYYVGVDSKSKNIHSAYRLLHSVLKKKGLAAIAVWVARNKENLMAIIPYGDGLAMYQLYYAAERREFSSGCTVDSVSDVDFNFALQLAETDTKSKFDLTAYSDNFISKVESAVKIKIDGGEISSQNIERKESSSNIAELLKESFRQKGLSEEQVNAILNNVKSL